MCKDETRHTANFSKPPKVGDWLSYRKITRSPFEKPSYFKRKKNSPFFLPPCCYVRKFRVPIDLEEKIINSDSNFHFFTSKVLFSSSCFYSMKKKSKYHLKFLAAPMNLTSGTSVMIVHTFN